MLEAKMNLLQLEQHTKVPKSTIQRLLTDPNLKPRMDSIKPIAQFFQITISQLLGEEPLPIKQDNHTDKNSWSKIPIITWEQAVTWPESKSNLKRINYIRTDSKVSKHAFGLVMNETMNDGFLKSAVVIFDPDLKPSENNYVLVYKKSSKIPSIKQLKLYDDEAYLKPLNEQFNSVTLNKDYKILAVAKQIRFDFIE